MKDFLLRLREKTAQFGNHYRKYIQAADRNLDNLVQRLEEEKKRDEVHIIHPAYDFGAELKIVGSVGKNTEEKLNFLGTYFALQFLLRNQQAIDLLRIDVIASEADKFSVYKKFMLDTGNGFRMLTAHYIEELLSVFIDREECPEFVILGVGTKSDQDDIDVGIIDDGKHDRKKFNRAICLISNEMLKYAVSFHFHLSEHIGSHYYSASIDEYKDVLKHEIRDYVIINEMLSGAVITGSKKLFAKYQKEVVDRYFYHSETDNKYHEGYLRGILGDVNSLLERPISSVHINFKEDALRMIKGVICAQKTIFNIDRVNAWDILEGLRARDAKRHHEYNALERALTFFEISRHLYQVFVTQDEEILLEDVALKNIRRAAKILGYSDLGKCHAEEHLLMHYYEHMQSIRRTIPVILNDIKKHLETNSIFVSMFAPDYQGNIAQDFLRKFKFFRGTSFWDDILDDFKNEELLKRFVNDLNAFQVSIRKKIIKGYMEWVRYDFYSLIMFLTILGKTKSGFPIYKDLNDYLLQIMDTLPDVVRKIAYVFNRFPHLINSYLSLGDEKVLESYLKVLEGRVYEKEILSVIDNLKYLIRIHLHGSLFFKRYFLRILSRYPETITLLSKPAQLEEFAAGIYSDVASMRTSKEKKEKLGDYYDFEMMRLGLKTLSGVSVEETNAAFTEFSDKYIATLFDICRREIDIQYTKRIITDDLLAIFAAGGHAREQAYDDDYDIIVLLNSDKPAMLSYCNKIISKMNGEIIKRGTIPHHRFADYFGRYVILLKEVEQLLRQKRPDIFVEKSQILGARLIVGSHRFEKEFVDRVVKPYIFDMKDDYIKQMKQEISSRHSATDSATESLGIDIKESVGGLRDIEMMMLMIKAQFNIMEPFNAGLFKYIADMRKDLKDELLRLAKACRFLKNLRDVYRLTAGASDTILPEALKTSAEIMRYKSIKHVYNKLNRARRDVKRTIAHLIAKM